MPAPMISRVADPILGVATGVFAFWLNEHDDRAAPPDGYTLSELIRWRFPRAEKTVTAATAGGDDQGLRELLKEIGVETK